MKQLPFSIPAQPDDETCGIACLLGYYRYLGLDIDFPNLSSEVEMLDSGGTLGVNLGIHALKRQMDVSLTSYNLQIFDPSWSGLAKDAIIDKLKQQISAKSYDLKLVLASEAYIRFLELGGKIKFGDCSVNDIVTYIDQGIPVLVGLSSTFLYQSKREIPETTAPDDIRGYPAGHFVVINGYDAEEHKISVCDPYSGNPFSGDQTPYLIDVDHLMTSIFLGILTYDANFLTIQPR